MDKYKKSLIIMWSAMGVVVIACIAFLTVGILLHQYQAGLKPEVYFTVTQNSNDYLLSDGETLELEFACEEGGSATIRAEAHYIVHHLKNESNITDFQVPLDNPQTYEFKQVFNYSGKEAAVKISVKVVDPTPAPTLKLSAFDCIEFEFNKRYVYRYDGTEKYPKDLMAYNSEGRYIGTFNTWNFIKNITTLDGEPAGFAALENVGKYKCDVIIDDYGTYDHGNNYKPSGIYGLIIEIIP